MTTDIQKAKAAAMKHAATLGAQAAKGIVAYTDLAVSFSKDVREGTLEAADGTAYYLAYAKAHNTGIDEQDAIPADVESAKVSISTLKTFALPAVIAAGEGWFKRLDTVRLGLPSDNRRSVFNTYVAANRKLRDECKDKGLVTATAQADFAAKVPDADVEGWVAKVAAATKDDLAKLKDLAAKVDKLGDKLVAGVEVKRLAQCLMDIASGKVVLTLVKDAA